MFQRYTVTHVRVPPAEGRGPPLTWDALAAGVRVPVGGAGGAGRAVVHPAQQGAQVAHRDLLDEGRPVLAEVPPLEDLQHTGERQRRPRPAPAVNGCLGSSARSPVPPHCAAAAGGTGRDSNPRTRAFLPSHLPAAPPPAEHPGPLAAAAASRWRAESLNSTQVRAESGKSL